MADIYLFENEVGDTILVPCSEDARVWFRRLDARKTGADSFCVSNIDPQLLLSKFPGTWIIQHVEEGDIEVKKTYHLLIQQLH